LLVIQEELFSRLDITSHSQLASTSRRFSQLARSETSWAGVTGLRVWHDRGKETLQVTMADGRRDSFAFTDSLELVCKKTKLNPLIATLRALFLHKKNCIKNLFFPL
jgi:hypothetical protein